MDVRVHIEGWVQKNWYFFESPLDYKEIKPVNAKGNQSWVFTGMADAEAETAILCHLMRKANSLDKTLMLGKTEGRRRRQKMKWFTGITDSIDLSLRKLQETVRDREALGTVIVGIAESDTSEQLNNNEW